MKPVSLALLRGIDQNLLAVLSQIATELETLGGVRGNQSILVRAATINDLISLGVLAIDSSGRLYNPNIATPGFSDASTAISIEDQQYANYALDATAGKAIGTHDLTGAVLPDNAIIIRARYSVETTFTSLTDAATIAIGVETDDSEGIVAPTAIDAAGDVWDAGVHDGIPDQSDSSTYTTKTTAIGRKIRAIVAGENLTAGVLTLAITYIIRE